MNRLVIDVDGFASWVGPDEVAPEAPSPQSPPSWDRSLVLKPSTPTVGPAADAFTTVDRLGRWAFSAAPPARRSLPEPGDVRPPTAINSPD
jgi:hypothetical protein